mmetsp:Transcript_23907/g.68673  ORF Transcript_23907/g.68673 Transcript_23907/m.68673 type:complete len:361 (-) Transcript_23907:1296-2378(-)
MKSRSREFTSFCRYIKSMHALHITCRSTPYDALPAPPAAFFCFLALGLAASSPSAAFFFLLFFAGFFLGLSAADPAAAVAVAAAAAVPSPEAAFSALVFLDLLLEPPLVVFFFSPPAADVADAFLPPPPAPEDDDDAFLLFALLAAWRALVFALALSAALRAASDPPSLDNLALRPWTSCSLLRQIFSKAMRVMVSFRTESYISQTLLVGRGSSGTCNSLRTTSIRLRRALLMPALPPDSGFSSRPDCIYGVPDFGTGAAEAKASSSVALSMATSADGRGVAALDPLAWPCAAWICPPLFFNLRICASTSRSSARSSSSSCSSSLDRYQSRSSCRRRSLSASRSKVFLLVVPVPPEMMVG